MGKIKQSVSTAGLRVGNTIATPLRRGGEIANALGNVPRQGYSSVKNIKEVQIQSLNALMHNFLNFSKVDGKWYQKMIKVPLNLASAVTRRPAMIGMANAMSTLNQGVRQPFKKLLYTPGKMFKGMRNATRIFSKKKGFDFQTYDTHETKDTRIANHKDFGFLGTKGGSSKPDEHQKASSPEPEKESDKKASDKKTSDKKVPDDAGKKKVDMSSENKSPEKGSKERIDKMAKEKNDKEVDDYLKERGYPAGRAFGTEQDIPSKPSSEKPKSIEGIQKQQKEESVKKDEKESAAKEWKNQPKKFKDQFEKEFKKMLDNKITKEGVIERGKKNKKGDSLEEIMSTLKKDYITFAGYIEEKILSQPT